MKPQRHHARSQFAISSRSTTILNNLDAQLLEISSVELLIKTLIEALQDSIVCHAIRIFVFNRFHTGMWIGSVEENASAINIIKQEISSETPPPAGQTPQIIIEDLHTVQHLSTTQSELLADGVCSYLYAPLHLHKRLTGFIELGEKSVAYFTPEHQNFVALLAPKISIALRYLWLAEEVLEHDNELENALYEYVQAQEEIRKQEINYQNIVEDQTELICRYDANFVLTFVNRAYAAFYGKQPSEMIGSNILDLIPLEDREHARAYVRTLTRDNPASTSEHQSITPEGTTRWHQWRDRALLDEDGNILEYQGVGRDITSQILLQQEQKQHAEYIEQTRQFLQATLDALPANTVVLDQSGTIISANAPWKNYALLNDVAAPNYFVGANYLAICDNATGEMSEGAAEAAAGIRAVISGKQDHFYLEYTYRVQNITNWFGMNVSPFDEPAPRRVVISHIDVGERKAAELALQQAKDTLEERVLERTYELQRTKSRVEAILDSSSDAILLVTSDLSIQQTNLIFRSMFACDVDSYSGKSLLELVDSETSSIVAELVQQDVTHTNPPSGEVHARRKDGTIFDAEFSIGYIGGSYPNDKGLVCTIRDISERKQRERLLHYYGGIQENVSDAVIATDMDFRILSWNKAAENLYGWRAEEVLGQFTNEIFHSQFASDLRREETIKRLLRDGYWKDELTQQHKDGTRRDILGSVSVLRDENGIAYGAVSINRDITERKKTEEALRAYAAELDDLYNNAPCGYHSLDADGVFIRINDTELEWLGYSREEVIGKLKLTDILTPEGKKVFQENFQLFKSRGHVHDLSYELVCKDGHVIPVLLSAVAIYDEHGEYSMNRATFFDITELKKSQDALRDSETKFRMFIEAAPIATIISDATGSIILINRQTETLFGYSRNELLGQPIETVIPETIRQRHVQHRASYLAAPHMRPMGMGLELFAQRNDGSKFPVEVELSYVQTQTGILVMAFIVDITERKERERQLRYHASLQENVTDAVISTDLEFNIQSWNRAAERIYGWRADEVQRKNISDILQTTFSSDISRERVRQDFLERGHWTDEVIQHHKDGHPIQILGSVVLFKDDDGRALGIVAVNHDITERKQAEAVLRAKAEEELLFQSYLKELHDISIELTQIDHLDDFYKKTVDLGLKRLGFDRLGLLLFDADSRLAVGTFGTDADGNVIDEHDLRFDPTQPTGILSRTLEQAERFSLDEHAQLYTWEGDAKFKFISSGWNAAAVLWNDKQNLGWLTADNAIQHKPPTKPLLDILRLYALTIGTLLGRKRVEVALRESEANLRSVMNSTSIGIILIDRDGVIRLANQLAHDYCNALYRQKLEPGKTTLFDVSVSHETAENVYRQVFKGERVTSELAAEIDGKKQSLDIRYDPVITSDGMVIGTAVSFINVTQYKQAEEALRQAIQKEHELGELKSRFVSMASHEFRTPLATILAVTETLSVYRHKMADDQINNRLFKIQDQVSHLKGIMDDVLQLARLQARRADFNPALLNPDALCRSILDEFQSQPNSTHQLLYTCDNANQEASLDSKLMRQIISNLISNAIKYSAAHKPITVSLQYTAETLVLSVRDGGIGIPKDDLKHLFEPFHRATNVGTISGTGLGLVITKESVELHGGTIIAESQVNIGTTFIVTLPLFAQGIISS